MGDAPDVPISWTKPAAEHSVGSHARCSATIGRLALALAKAQASMRHAKKDATNPFFKSRYADLPATLEACREALTAHELAVIQPVTADGPKVIVTTVLAHSSGEWIASDLAVLAKDAGAQAIGSAITYARRYGLASTVGVAADDDDGEAAEDRKPREMSRKATTTTAETPHDEVHDPVDREVELLLSEFSRARSVLELDSLKPRVLALPIDERHVVIIAAKKRKAELAADDIHENLGAGSVGK